MAGWLWNSDNEGDTQAPRSEPAETAREQHTPQQVTHPTPRTSAPTPKPQTSAGRTSASARIEQLNRDETALEELRAAFASSLADPSCSTSGQTSQQDTPSIPQDYDTSLYPDTLSCSQCFDAAYYCSSVGGQLNSLYRYGAMRSCSDLWAQWRFCMRTKTMGEEERRRRVWEWNREKEARRRVGRNSEEVWSLRTEGPPQGALGVWYENAEEEP